MNNLIESIKYGVIEAGRVVILAALPVIIDGLSTGALDVKLVVITGVIAFLRFADKALHKYGEATNNKILEKGITQI